MYKSWNLPFIESETYINNITSETCIAHWEGGSTDVYTYTYEYNESNYPVKITEGANEYSIVVYEER